MVDEIKIGNAVKLTLGRIGVVKEIVTNVLGWFPYKVLITNNTMFNNIGDIVEFKKDEIQVVNDIIKSVEKL